MTMLKDPGVPESVYLHYIKVNFGHKLDVQEDGDANNTAITRETTINEIGEDAATTAEDIEGSSNTVQ